MPKIKIIDGRKIDTSSGKPVGPKNNFTGNYDPEIIKDIVTVAKEHNIDPYTFLATAMQETTLGTRSFKMTGMKDGKKVEYDPMEGVRSTKNVPEGPYKKYLQMPYQRIDLMSSDFVPEDFNSEEYFNKNMSGLDEGGVRRHILGLQANFFNQRLKEADRLSYNKTEAQRLQSWNGYPNKLYIETAPHGNKVVDLRDNVIKKNPEVASIVNDVYGGDPIGVSKEHFDDAKNKLGFKTDEDFQKWFQNAKGKIVTYN